MAARAGARQRERLFHEYVLAGLGRRHDFFGMLGMRRRQHHRVDGLVGQHRGIVRRQREAIALGERFRAARSRVTAAAKADLAALALAPTRPAACPNGRRRNRRAQHVYFPDRAGGTQQEAGSRRQLWNRRHGLFSYERPDQDRSHRSEHGKTEGPPRTSASASSARKTRSPSIPTRASRPATRPRSIRASPARRATFMAAVRGFPPSQAAAVAAAPASRSARPPGPKVLSAPTA